VTVDFDVDPDLLMRVRVSLEFGTDPLRLTLSDEPVRGCPGSRGT